MVISVTRSSTRDIGCPDADRIWEIPHKLLGDELA